MCPSLLDTEDALEFKYCPPFPDCLVVKPMCVFYLWNDPHLVSNLNVLRNRQTLPICSTNVDLIYRIISFVFTEPRFSSRKTSVFRRDLTSNELTKLFNSKVEIAEYMTRPLDGKIFSSSGRKKRFWGNYKLEHAGVRVTLSDDSKWLIHKGNDFGDVSSTVITSAEYMSSRWTMERRKMVNGALIVDDFMQAAYINEPYNLVNIRGANCQKAAHAMFDLLDGFPEN